MDLNGNGKADKVISVGVLQSPLPIDLDLKMKSIISLLHYDVIQAMLPIDFWTRFKGFEGIKGITHTLTHSHTLAHTHIHIHKDTHTHTHTKAVHKIDPYRFFVLTDGKVGSMKSSMS